MHWSRKYVGIPYVVGGRNKSGLDCWGLVRLIYQEEHGIALPELPGITTESALRVCREIQAEVRTNWVQLDKPADKCVVAMSQREALHHVGIWTEADGGLTIHAWSGFSVVAETFRFLKLKGFRVFKFYRYGVHH